MLPSTAFPGVSARESPRGESAPRRGKLHAQILRGRRDDSRPGFGDLGYARGTRSGA